MDTPAPASRDQQRIAVIGAGPSGLAAAWSLGRFDRYVVDVWTGSVGSPTIAEDDAADLSVGMIPVVSAWWRALGIEATTQSLTIAPPDPLTLKGLRRWRLGSRALRHTPMSLDKSLELQRSGDLVGEFLTGLVAATTGFGSEPGDVPLALALEILDRLACDPFDGETIRLPVLLGARRILGELRAHPEIPDAMPRSAARVTPHSSGLIVHDERGRCDTYDRVVVATGPAELRRLIPDHALAQASPRTARILRLVAVPSTRRAAKLADPRLVWSRADDDLWSFEVRSGDVEQPDRVILGSTERLRAGVDVSIRPVRRPSPIPFASGPTGASWRRAQGADGVVATLGWALGHDIDTSVSAGLAVADRLGAPWPFRANGEADRRFSAMFATLHGEHLRAWRRAVTVPHTEPDMDRPPAWTPDNPATTR